MTNFFKQSLTVVKKTKNRKFRSVNYTTTRSLKTSLKGYDL